MVRKWQRFAEPALSAVPIQPYPVNSALRWVLLAVFVVYLLTGGATETRFLVPIGLGVALVVMGATEAAFYRFRRKPERLLQAWSVIVFCDVFVLVLATLVDSDEHSPIPAIAVATIFSASEMFRPRYVVTLAITAALAFGIEHAAVDLAQGQTSFATPIIWAIVLVGVGSFASTRGLADEKLRRELIEAERREREQSDSLRDALASVRSSESRFETFSDHAPALMLMFDQEAKLTFRNSFPEPVTAPLATADGAPIPGLTLSAEDARQVTLAVSAAVQGAAQSVDISVMSQGGRRLRLRGAAFQIESGAGVILRDVTTELELASQVSRAQQLETVGTLAGGVAHDFNNLLTAILGNLYLVKGSLPEDSPALPLVDEAKFAGERGAELVRRLLDYGRPTLDRVDSTDLNNLIRATVELARPALSPRVSVEAKGCDGATVLGNFGSLQQVLLNLLFNARDAMPEGGAIRISCREIALPDHLVAGPGGEFWEIAVSDTGIGMSAETSARIFDPFFTTKEIGAGSGLGLATSLSIVRAHGGSISVESEEGKGTTFRVHLPATSADRS
ncbi:MAG: ATP-binding protein [bacterium]